MAVDILRLWYVRCRIIIKLCLGVCGGVITALWCWQGVDTPAEHRTISPKEQEYFISGRRGNGRKATCTPWKTLFTSAVVWSLILCTISQAFVLVCLTTYLPKFFHEIFDSDISKVRHAGLGI